MKKHHTLPKVILVMGVVIGAFLPSYQAIAWGPERETFKWADAAPYRTMNSITDNPAIGDERNFVRIRKVGDAVFVDEVTLEPGQQYEVEIYFHNNASESLNASGAGVANNVRMNTILPSFVAKGTRADITGMISSANTNPESVWDETHVVANEDVYLRYVPDSAIIISNGTIDRQHIGPDYLFSSEGALIGYSNDYWGILPGCNQYAGYVSYKFVVEQPGFEVVKEVSKEGANEWSKSVSAGPGEVLDYRVRFRNTGSMELNDVVVSDELPTLLEYVGGSTYLNGGKVGDELFMEGLSLGTMAVGSEATLTYKVRMPGEEALQCGSNVLTNAVSVATPNGTMRDSVEVTVNRNCMVTELPKTGPADVALMVAAVLAMGVGGMYFWRSSRLLKQTKKAVGVDGEGKG